MDKAIITVAVTGNFHGKESNPAFPLGAEETADAVFEAWNEGASIVHIHGRRKDGSPTNDPEFFEEVDGLIRKKSCDIIIQHSMAPANPYLLGLNTNIADVDDGTKTSFTSPPPEMVSLEVSPSNMILEGKVIETPWNRLWAERVALDLRKRNIKPEVEIYNNSDMDDLEYLIEREVMDKPYSISFVLGMHRVNNQASRYSPKHLMHLYDLLPKDCRWSVVGIGKIQFEAITMSLLLGGSARVGFEDNIYIAKGKLAESNAQCVAKIVRMARDIGRDIASPSETREILGIPPLKTGEDAQGGTSRSS
jgi:3-keto-5-aminohexanoate cleavage enzyme